MSDPNSSQLSLIAPVFPVSDVATAVAYYRDRLLFEVRFEWADNEGEPARYAILGRDKIELHLTGGDALHPRTAYCFVDGIDGYYALARKAGANITEDIGDQPWEMREFETKDPDGNALIFGEHLSRKTD
ncbi:VOC family protein [uncultured Roseibium sp.]|uniref:bleomycin resistance protein n=1 Tax=uncultured Roseibium sp. TaxID=1936171 RepID=UPI002602677C|nr:VOC family protein [uncultured Roseibium sp.]